MKRYILNECKAFPNFIGSWLIQDTDICDIIIDYFEKNKSKQVKGNTLNGYDKDTKDTTDIVIRPKEILSEDNKIFRDYFQYLFKCQKDYIDQWPFLMNLGFKYQIGSFNLQKYKPGQHFRKIHTERSSLDSLHRVFAFMTYLNNVEDGGETYFSHYDLEISPRKGLTLIWPAEWTHAHRGNELKAGIKYIITGWIEFAV